MIVDADMNAALHRVLSRDLRAGLGRAMEAEALASIALTVIRGWHDVYGCPESEAAYVRGVRAGRAGEQ